MMRSAIDNKGSVLLMVLFGVTLLGLLIGLAGSSWQTIVQRAREEDLLWKGNRIRQAIGLYYETSHGGETALKRYPRTLDDLLKDPRFLDTRRYLRRLYPDPMTGQEWELITEPGGRVMGVHSTLDKLPFKQDGFTEDNENFTEKESYRQWEFVYLPKKKS